MSARLVWAWTTALLTLAAIACLAWRFWNQGYLPQPFYFRPDDSLMDLYSTAFWANTTEAYARWHALYPPLSFAFLKVFSVHRCYMIDGAHGRGCDPLPMAALGAFYLLNSVLVFASLRLVDRSTAAPRTLILLLGLPMLYALERGNLLIPTFTGIVLGLGGLLRKAPWRWFAMAWAINFKPYVLIAGLSRIAKWDWRWFVGVVGIGLAIYAASYVFYGSGTIDQIVRHESSYGGATSTRYFDDLYYATSYWPLIRVLRAAPAGMHLLSAPWSAAVAFGLEAVIRVTQFAGLLCLLVSARWPDRVDVRRFCALSVAISLTAFTTGSAGYTQIFLFFLLLLEPRRGAPYAALIACVYLLSIPADVTILSIVHRPVFSFLGGRVVIADFGVSIGQLVRPAVLLVIQVILIGVSVRDLLRPADGSVAVSTPSR